jgi:hypothetical protein
MRGSLTIQKFNRIRSGYHQIDDQPTANYEVQEFVKKISTLHAQSRWSLVLKRNRLHTELLSCSCWFLVLIRYPLARKLYSQIKSAYVVGLKDEFFRSRPFSCGCSKPLSDCLGPPPLDKQTPGRYTEGYDVVLYLSKNPQTAAIESCASEEKPRIFVQRFCLDFPDLRVLYLTASFEKTYPHLYYLLLNSEYLKGEVTHLTDPYRATQFIAYLCRRCGVNAVEYPSVRGDFKRNPDAINLVVFGQFVAKATKMMNGEPFQYNTN